MNINEKPKKISEAEVGGHNVNNLQYDDDTVLIAQKIRFATIIRHYTYWKKNLRRWVNYVKRLFVDHQKNYNIMTPNFAGHPARKMRFTKQ